MDMGEELEQEDPLEGSSSVAASKGVDSTYDPADSVTYVVSNYNMSVSWVCVSFRHVII